MKHIILVLILLSNTSYADAPVEPAVNKSCEQTCSSLPADETGILKDNCLAYYAIDGDPKKGNSAILWNEILLGGDLAVASMCTLACFQPANPTISTICSGLAIAESANELAAVVMLSQNSCQDYITEFAAAGGVTGGIAVKAAKKPEDTKKAACGTAVLFAALASSRAYSIHQLKNGKADLCSKIEDLTGAKLNSATITTPGSNNNSTPLNPSNPSLIGSSSSGSTGADASLSSGIASAKTNGLSSLMPTGLAATAAADTRFLSQPEVYKDITSSIPNLAAFTKSALDNGVKQALAATMSDQSIAAKLTDITDKIKKTPMESLLRPTSSVSMTSSSKITTSDTPSFNINTEKDEKLTADNSTVEFNAKMKIQKFLLTPPQQAYLNMNELMKLQDSKPVVQEEYEQPKSHNFHFGGSEEQKHTSNKTLIIILFIVITAIAWKYYSEK